MAQYATDFSEYTTGVQPSDWSLRFGLTRAWTVESVVDATGGKVLRAATDASNVRTAITWDAVDADADRAEAEVRFRVRWATGSTEIRGLLRGSGTSTANYSDYHIGIRPDTNSRAISKHVSGTFSDVLTNSFVFSANVWYTVVAQAFGTALKLKYWDEGEPEPAGWDLESTDSSVTAAGWLGLYSNRSTTFDIDFFSVGTNGDSAPSAVLGREVSADAESYAPGGTATVSLTMFDGSPTAIALEYEEDSVDVTALASSITSSGFSLSIAALAEFAAGESHAGIRWAQDLTLRVTEAGGSATTIIQIVAPDTDGPVYWAGTVTTASGDTALPAGSEAGDDTFFEVKTGTNVVVNTSTGSSGADSSSWSVAGRYYDVSASSWSSINTKELTDTPSGLSIPIAMHYYRQMAR